MNISSLFFFLSAVFCADRPSSTSNSSSDNHNNANANKFNEFVVESLPHLIPLSKLTEYFSERVDDPTERLYSSFFKDVQIHFVPNGKWEGTFWGVCNNHTYFREASLIDEAEKAVLAAYGITVDKEKNIIRLYLQDLCRQSFQEGFVLEVEVMYLFLTYLAHQVQEPLRSTFVVERPRRRLNAPIPVQVASNPVDAFLEESNDVMDVEEVATDIETTTSSFDSRTLISDVKSICFTKMERFFFKNGALETIDRPTIKSFMEYVQPFYKEFKNPMKPKWAFVESIWFNVLRVIVTALFPNEVKGLNKSMSALDAITIICNKHGLKLFESEGAAITYSDMKEIKPALQAGIGKYLNIPNFKFF